MSEESPLPLPPAEEARIADAEPANASELEPAESAPEPINEPPFVCECDEQFRMACNDEPFYDTHEGNQYCVLHYPGKNKAPDFEIAFRKKIEAKDFDFSGVWFPEAVHFSNAAFNALADFSHAAFNALVDFSHTTFNALVDFSYATFNAEASFRFAIFNTLADFNSATFSTEASFNSAKFSAEASFRSATFNAKASFDSVRFSGEADFRSTIFGAASFTAAKFSALASFTAARFSTSVDFLLATFSAETSFNSATFNGEASFSFVTFNAEASFISAIFSGETSFSYAEFSAKVPFSFATFKERVNFSGINNFGSQSAFDLQFVRIEKPERVSFYAVTLHPHWFVNVDSRKFVFTDVEWNWKTISIPDEIQSLTKNGTESPSRLLAIACRQLAENAEANNRYEEASHFRYWAMDLARHHKWAGLVFWKTDWLHMLYWAVSGYGERILRATAWLVAVWIVFALLYTKVGFTKPEDKSATPTANPITATEPDTIGQPLPIKRAFIYSFGVMSLQKPEPKPLTGTAQTLVLLETILGPLQAALLALAIRRKFMR